MAAEEAWERRERLDEDAIAATYDHTHHASPIARYWDDDFGAFVARHCKPGDRILDVGCGPGSLWRQWRRLPSPARLVGVDISPAMVEAARRRYPDGEFEVARVHALPFEPRSFDVVIASSVLHHVPDDRLRAAFDEIARVLNDYGRVVGREPSSAHSLGSKPGWISGAIMNFRHLVMSRTATREAPDVTLGEHHHVPDARSFVETLGEALRPLEVESRFPFSSAIMRVDSELVARVARAIDARLASRAGSMFYYVAAKGFATAEDVARCVEMALKDEVVGVDEAEFLALLRVASERLETILADGDTRR